MAAGVMLEQYASLPLRGFDETIALCQEILQMNVAFGLYPVVTKEDSSSYIAFE